MTGKVKAFYHDEICERANDPGPDPSDLELLLADAEMALERYQRALKEFRETHNEAAE